MVVFLPLLLIKGQAGQMFTQFALVVIFSLAVSLLDATTVVPMLATRLISGEAHREKPREWANTRVLLNRAFACFGRWFDALDAHTGSGLHWAIHHRWLVLGGAFALCLASFLLLPQIGTEMMPQTDSGDFTISIKMPVGTALAKTDAMMKQVEQITLQNPNVRNGVLRGRFGHEPPRQRHGPHPLPGGGDGQAEG